MWTGSGESRVGPRSLLVQEFAMFPVARQEGSALRGGSMRDGGGTRAASFGMVPFSVR